MRARSFLFLLLPFLPVVAACTADDGNGPPAETTDDEVKRRVSGSGATARVIVPAAPSWYSVGASTTALFFDDQVASFGKTRDVPPGKHTVKIASHGRLIAPSFQYPVLDLAAGSTTTLEAPGGVFVRRDRSVTWQGEGHDSALIGKNPADGKPVAVTRELGRRMDGVDPIEMGEEFLVPAGTYQLRSDGTDTPITIAPGKHVDVVFPSATIEVVTDPIDPAFPNPNAFGGSFYVVDSGDQNFVEVRAFGKRIVRPGAVARVKNAWGLEVKATARPSAPAVLHLNRLEIEPLTITTNGTPQTVHATWRLAVWVDSQWKNVGANYETNTGIDVPDGKYRVTYRSYGGDFTDVREVSFP